MATKNYKPLVHRLRSLLSSMDLEDEYVHNLTSKNRSNGNFFESTDPSKWISAAFTWNDSKWSSVNDRWLALLSNPKSHARTVDEHKESVRLLKVCDATLLLLSEERPLKLIKIDNSLDFRIALSKKIKAYEQYIRNSGKETRTST